MPDAPEKPKGKPLPQDHWTLDKRVNLSVVIAVVVQAALILVGGTLFWVQVQQNTAQLAKLPATFPPVSLTIKITRLETQMESLRRSVDRLTFTIRRTRSLPPEGP